MSKKLTEGEYWQWRCSIEEVKLSKVNEKRVLLQQELMQQEIEIKKLKLALFKDVINASKRSKEHVKKEYDDFVQQLEKKLNIDMRNCTIDELTFEVRSLSEEDDNN